MDAKPQTLPDERHLFLRLEPSLMDRLRLKRQNPDNYSGAMFFVMRLTGSPVRRSVARGHPYCGTHKFTSRYVTTVTTGTRALPPSFRGSIRSGHAAGFLSGA